MSRNAVDINGFACTSVNVYIIAERNDDLTDDNKTCLGARSRGRTTSKTSDCRISEVGDQVFDKRDSDETIKIEHIISSSFVIYDYYT